jgi:hypothetical protein
MSISYINHREDRILPTAATLFDSLTDMKAITDRFARDIMRGRAPILADIVAATSFCTAVLCFKARALHSDVKERAKFLLMLLPMIVELAAEVGVAPPASPIAFVPSSLEGEARSAAIADGRS